MATVISHNKMKNSIVWLYASAWLSLCVFSILGWLRRSPPYVISLQRNGMETYTQHRIRSRSAFMWADHNNIIIKNNNNNNNENKLLWNEIPSCCLMHITIYFIAYLFHIYRCSAIIIVPMFPYIYRWDSKHCLFELRSNKLHNPFQAYSSLLLNVAQRW